MTGFAAWLSSVRPAPDEDRTLTIEQAVQGVLGRASSWHDRRPDPVDPDDHVDELMSRGVRPGETSRLAQQLIDVDTEIESENEKIDRYKRHEQHVARMHQNGRIGAMDIPRMLGDGEGDVDRLARLERRRDRLRAQQATQQTAISPPQAQRSQDPLEAASARAHEAFRARTRELMADAEAGRLAVRSTPARRPFGGVAVDGDDEPATGCGECVKLGVSRRVSRQMHAVAPDMARTSSAGMISR